MSSIAVTCESAHGSLSRSTYLIAPALPREGEAWPLTVQPETGVRRFALRPVTGIDPTALSPWWLQRRLLLGGIRAISPAVDATNYVMLELGHPMHAHDLNRITGGLAVRFAADGETAVWDPAAVSRTARRLHLPSEAARRYERSVDPAISVAALDRCAALLADIAGGEVSAKITDWRGDPPREDWSLPPIRLAADLP